MARKKKDAPVPLDEPLPNADAGRMAGVLARQDPDLWNAVKQYAALKGVSPGDALKELVTKGLAYEMYRDIDGATIMKVMDILDRMYGYMNGWLQKTSLEQNLSTFQALIQLTDALAPTLGYVKYDEIKPKIEAKEMAEKVKKRTIIDELFDRLVDRAAEKVVESVMSNKEMVKYLEQYAKRMMEGEEGGGTVSNTEMEAADNT